MIHYFEYQQVTIVLKSNPPLGPLTGPSTNSKLLMKIFLAVRSPVENTRRLIHVLKRDTLSGSPPLAYTIKCHRINHHHAEYVLFLKFTEIPFEHDKCFIV